MNFHRNIYLVFHRFRYTRSAGIQRKSFVLEYLFFNLFIESIFMLNLSKQKKIQIGASWVKTAGRHG